MGSSLFLPFSEQRCLPGDTPSEKGEETDPDLTPVVPRPMRHAVDHAIEARGLVKRFGDKVAVDALDLTVPRGSWFGLVGPNGAGKTTTIKMVVGLLRPDAGTVQHRRHRRLARSPCSPRPASVSCPMTCGCSNV